MTCKNTNGSHLISDALWEQIEPLLSPELPKSSGGRPRMDNRKVMEAILHVLRTGCIWNSLPRSLGATSTIRRRFLEWRETGMFQRMWQVGILTYYDGEKITPPIAQNTPSAPQPRVCFCK